MTIAGAPVTATARALACAATLAVLGMGASAGAGATVMRVGALDTSYADVRAEKSLRRPTYRSLRITLTAAATGRPYTLDDSYSRIYGPPQAFTPTASGSYAIACEKARPFAYRYSSGTMTTLPVRVRLPVRRPDRCTLTLSGSAYVQSGEASIMVDQVSVRVVATSVR